MSTRDCVTDFKIIVEVPNSILGLPHFNSLDKRWLSFVNEPDKCKILNMVAFFRRPFGLVR